MRAFLAIVPNSSVLAFVHEQVAQLRRTSWAASIRWTEESTWHITLRFLGEIEQAQAGLITRVLRDGLHNHAAFQVHISQPRWFPNPAKPRVIACMSEHSPPLSALARFCEDAAQSIGLPPDPRGFNGHLTLGRVRDNIAPGTRAVLPARMSVAMHVREVVLFKSELTRAGPIYTRLATVALLPPHP